MKKYKVSLGKDFLEKNLSLLHDWDFGKNGSIGVSSNNKETGLDEIVWWHCDSNHNYQATVNEVVSNKGRCPLCEIQSKRG